MNWSYDFDNRLENNLRRFREHILCTELLLIRNKMNVKKIVIGCWRTTSSSSFLVILSYIGRGFLDNAERSHCLSQRNIANTHSEGLWQLTRQMVVFKYLLYRLTKFIVRGSTLTRQLFMFQKFVFSLFEMVYHFITVENKGQAHALRYFE